MQSNIRAELRTRNFANNPFVRLARIAFITLIIAGYLAFIAWRSAVPAQAWVHNKHVIAQHNTLEQISADINLANQNIDALKAFIK